MPRRRVIAAREILPDPKFGSKTIAKFINHVMVDGKKSVAEKIVYGALDRVIEKNNVADPVAFFEDTLEKVRPMVEVKARRVGGSNYQVPVEVRPERRSTLGLRWLVNYARLRGEHTMDQRLAKEIMDAANNSGASVKKREDVHKMAEANRAFAHYRW